MAVINLRRGVVLDSEVADTYCVSVNAVGAMGAGIAADCKLRYPDIYERYRTQCKNKMWKPGMVALMVGNTGERILLVSTKDHWQAPSEYVWIESILDKIAESYERYDIRTLAMPHLGCGNGGLDKTTVRKMIDERLGHCLLDIELYF